MTLWIVLAVLAAIAGFVGWLVWPGAGLRFDWNGLRFRVRFRSPLAWLIRMGRHRFKPDGTPVNHALVVFGVIHVRYNGIGPELLAHEVGHVKRAKGRPLRYLWRYLVSNDFREDEEAACWEFSREHAGDPFLRRVSEFRA